MTSRSDSALYEFKVIGDGDPEGICGSGMVDLLAHLVRSGRVMNTGRFSAEMSGKGEVILPGEEKLALTRKDIDTFQRAKAAIGLGVHVLPVCQHDN